MYITGLTREDNPRILSSLFLMNTSLVAVIEGGKSVISSVKWSGLFTKKEKWLEALKAACAKVKLKRGEL